MPARSERIQKTAHESPKADVRAEFRRNVGKAAELLHDSSTTAEAVLMNIDPSERASAPYAAMFSMMLADSTAKAITSLRSAGLTKESNAVAKLREDALEILEFEATTDKPGQEGIAEFRKIVQEFERLSHHCKGATRGADAAPRNRPGKRRE